MNSICPYVWSPGQHFGLHGHVGRPIWDEPELNSARWAFDPLGRCCEFCDVWNELPYVEDILAELSFWDPYRYAHIMQMHETIHGHYMLGFDRDGSESYYLSREIEKLSRMLQKVYRHNPWIDRRFGDIASQLKYMGRDVQIGPRRRRYHSLPQPRYWDGRFYPGQRRLM